MLWCARIEALGRVAELVDAADLKSADSNIVRVQVPPRPPDIIRIHLVYHAAFDGKEYGDQSLFEFLSIMTLYARSMALPNLPLRTKLSPKEQSEKLNPVKLHDEIEVLQVRVSYDVNLRPDR